MIATLDVFIIALLLPTAGVPAVTAITGEIFSDVEFCRCDAAHSCR